MVKFADRLKELRKEKKLTQQELANKVGVNRVTYTNWENGKREPELDKVVELATELNSTLDYLLGKTDTNILGLKMDKIKEMDSDGLEQIRKSLMQNMASIFDIGQQKFGTSDEDMELIKKGIFNELLKESSTQ